MIAAQLNPTGEINGVLIDQLLEPVKGDSPCGEWLKLESSYDEIRDARANDDPNLPFGDLPNDLMVANWSRVTELTIDLLQSRTKDLQLAIWLLESQIYLNGFSGISPSIQMIVRLMHTYWEDLHPLMVEGDIEYRTHLFNWMNEKLQPPVCRVDTTKSPGDRQYCWADWQRAVAMESLSNAQRPMDTRQWVKPSDIQGQVNATPIEN